MTKIRHETLEALDPVFDLLHDLQPLAHPDGPCVLILLRAVYHFNGQVEARDGNVVGHFGVGRVGVIDPVVIVVPVESRHGLFGVVGLRVRPNDTPWEGREGLQIANTHGLNSIDRAWYAKET